MWTTGAARGRSRRTRPRRARCWSTTTAGRGRRGRATIRTLAASSSTSRDARRSPWRRRSRSTSTSSADTFSLAAPVGRARAAVGAVEAAALEHDPDRGEHLAEPAGALGAVGQRRVGEGLHGLEPVSAGGAGVLVGRHGFLRSWHSHTESASLPRRDQSVPPSIVTPVSGRSAAVTRRSCGSAGSASTSSPVVEHHHQRDGRRRPAAASGRRSPRPGPGAPRAGPPPAPGAAPARRGARPPARAAVPAGSRRPNGPATSASGPSYRAQSSGPSAVRHHGKQHLVPGARQRLHPGRRTTARRRPAGARRPDRRSDRPAPARRR